MILEEVLRSQWANKLEDLVESLDENIRFVQVDDSKWQLVVDIDLKSLNAVEKAALEALMKHL
jgi:hypothetical protein